MEIWKNIEDYEGFYQCSNYGRIKSLDRIIIYKDGISYLKHGQIIKPRKNKNGYFQVALNKNGKRKIKYVHKIIANTFLEKTGMIVNHIDGNKENNNVTNLEWCSYSDNSLHAYRKLKRSIAKNGASKQKIKVTDIINKSFIIYPSILKTSKCLNLSETQVRRYLKNSKIYKGRYLIQINKDEYVEDIEKLDESAK